MALAVANYMVQPLFPGCEMPINGLRLIAALCITFLTWLNCYSMKVIFDDLNWKMHRRFNFF